LWDYAYPQAFADQTREAGTALLQYSSLRDPEHRSNLAVLSPTAFARPDPVGRQSWKLHVDANGVRAACESPHELIAFDRAAFSADPRLKDFRWAR